MSPSLNDLVIDAILVLNTDFIEKNEVKEGEPLFTPWSVVFDGFSFFVKLYDIEVFSTIMLDEENPTLDSIVEQIYQHTQEVFDQLKNYIS
jgi:hypothetical protein